MTLFAEPVPAASSRWRADALRALPVLIGTVLLGAPAGLLWSFVSPRVTVVIGDDGNVDLPGVESSDAFMGADGSFVLVAVLAGLLCGGLAYLLARRAGVWAVLALTVGGVLAALVAARVGVLPGRAEILSALRPGSSARGTFDLFLGARGEGDSLHLRAPSAVLAWPVGALVAFLGLGLAQDDDLT